MAVRMSIKNKSRLIRVNPLGALFAFYVSINAYYCALILRDGHLFGETESIYLDSLTLVVPVTALLLASYAFFCGPFFSFIWSAAGRQSIFSKSDGRMLSFFMLALQLAYLTYSLWSGTRTADASSRSTSLLSQFWVLVPVDVIVLAYYACSQRSRLVYANVFLWLLSGLLRGWTGSVMTVAVLEFAYWNRRRGFTIREMAATAAIILSVAPLFYYFKTFVRLRAFGVYNSLQDFRAALDNYDLQTLAIMSFEHLIERLHLASSALASFELSSALSEAVNRGQVYPFWLEGLPGVAIDRIAGYQPRQDIGQYIGYMIAPFNTDANWTSNPTFIGWTFIAPSWTLLLFTYTGVICYLSAYFTKKISSSNQAKDMLWYTWLVLLIPGWFGAFLLHLYGTIVFLLLAGLLGLDQAKDKS